MCYAISWRTAGVTVSPIMLLHFAHDVVQAGSPVPSQKHVTEMSFRPHLRLRCRTLRTAPLRPETASCAANKVDVTTKGNVTTRPYGMSIGNFITQMARLYLAARHTRLLCFAFRIVCGQKPSWLFRAGKEQCQAGFHGIANCLVRLALRNAWPHQEARPNHTADEPKV